MKISELEVRHKIIIGIGIILLFVVAGIVCCLFVDMEKEISKTTAVIVMVVLAIPLGLIVVLGIKLGEYLGNTLKE